MVVIEGTIIEHRPPRAKGPYRVLIEDETGDVLLVFFLANHQWIEKSLPVGARRWVSGKLELWDGHRQMVHPDRILDAEGLAKLAPVEPIYPLTEGLSSRLLSKAIEGALARLPALPEWRPRSRPALFHRGPAPRASPADAGRNRARGASAQTPRL
ncbi:protein of unknown function [Methylocella tundrae]|uniref:OB domain-containing protein n=1 Tax=Methylocella tundrae TaxID=227605 RepID=A0A4U8Z5W9_METTU|nr:protein of unknown function [Methylocella tundrae]